MFPLRRGRVEGALGGCDERPVLVGGEVGHKRPARKGRQARHDVEAGRPRLDDHGVRVVGHVAARPSDGAGRIVRADQRHRPLGDRNAVHRRAVRYIEGALELHDRRDRQVIASRRAKCGAQGAHRSVEHPGRDQ